MKFLYMAWFQVGEFRSQTNGGSASYSAAIRYQCTNEPTMACNQCVKNG